MKFIKFLIGITASFFFLYLVFHSLSLKSLTAALLDVKPVWLCSGLLCLVVAYLVRIKRSQVMLASLNANVSFARSAVPYMIAIAANNVLPLRAGDALRAINFSTWLKVSNVSVLAIMMVERLMDLLIIIASFGGALFLFHPQNEKGDILLHSSSTFLFVTAVCIVGLLLFPTLLRAPVEWVLNLVKRWAPRFEEKLRLHSDNLFNTLMLMTHKPRMALLLGYTGLSWFLEACTFYMIARAIPQMFNPNAGWLAMPVGTLSTALPSSPGYVGTFHYFVIVSAKALGNSTEASTAFAILIHLVLWLPITLCGALCFVYWTFKRSRASSSGFQPFAIRDT